MILRTYISIILSCFIAFNYAQNNVKNGYVKFYHENGKISSEGLMKDGKPDGFWKNYYQNGNLKITGNRKNFQLDSLWSFYDDKGRVNRTVTYKEGKKEGATKLYDTLGKVTNIEHYVNDVKEGVSKKFYPSGKVKTIIYFVKGKADGTAYEYAEDSTIISIVNYKSGITLDREQINRKDELGRKQGLWKDLYPNGDVKKEAMYSNDSLNGFVKEYDTKGNLTAIKKFDNGKALLHAPEVRQVEWFQAKNTDGTLKYEGVYDDGVAIGTHYTYKSKRICDSVEYFNDSTKVFFKKWICSNYSVPDSAIEYFNGIVVAKGSVDSARNRIGKWVEFHNTGEFRGKGIYVAGSRTGEWEFFYSSGKLEQKGRYDKKGKAQGVWKWYYESGNLMREENYVNGRREGIMTDFTEDGKIITKGNWMDNKKEGFWNYENSEYYEYGNYVNDEPDSLWKGFYKPEKTKLFVGKYVQGTPEGYHTFYFRNGKKMLEGMYVGGLKEGDWKFYDELGFNYLIINYKDDIEIKWQGEKIFPTYEQSLRTYNIKIGEDKTQTIKSKP
ncbi:MAG: toxin-antitoxin system YwqK family antitoxin [Sphingobacteriaceae bacterium]